MQLVRHRIDGAAEPPDLVVDLDLCAAVDVATGHRRGHGLDTLQRVADRAPGPAYQGSRKHEAEQRRGDNHQLGLGFDFLGMLERTLVLLEQHRDPPVEHPLQFVEGRIELCQPGWRGAVICKRRRDHVLRHSKVAIDSHANRGQVRTQVGVDVACRQLSHCITHEARMLPGLATHSVGTYQLDPADQHRLVDHRAQSFMRHAGGLQQAERASPVGDQLRDRLRLQQGELADCAPGHRPQAQDDCQEAELGLYR